MGNAPVECGRCNEQRGAGVGPPPSERGVEYERGEDGGAQAAIEKRAPGLGEHGLAPKLKRGVPLHDRESEHCSGGNGEVRDAERRVRGTFVQEQCPSTGGDEEGCQGPERDRDEPQRSGDVPIAGVMALVVEVTDHDRRCEDLDPGQRLRLLARPIASWSRWAGVSFAFEWSPNQV